MKNFCISLVVLLGSASSFALSPSLGDYAVYARKTPYSEYKRKDILTELNGEVWTMDSFITAPNGTEKFSKRQDFDPRMMSERYIRDLGAFCIRNAGVLENITISIGEFKTCKVTTHEGPIRVDSWWAQDLPMGLVQKLEMGEGDPRYATITELLSFHSME